MDKVSREKATEEVEKWLDYKKVYPSVKEAQKDSIDLLIEAVMQGDLEFNPTTHEITHRLLVPLDEVKEFKYKARLNDKMIKPHQQGVSPKDAFGQMLAYTAALTNQPKAVLEAVDTADKKIMMSISVFFV